MYSEQMLAKHPVLANPQDLVEGEEVVSWDGSRMVLGTYERAYAGEHLVRSGERSFMTNCVLRHKDAVDTGIWSFTNGLRVAAYLDGTWVEAAWLGYDGDRHIVQTNGKTRTSERAHRYEDAVTMGLFQPLAA
jgi:hypothetical protein